MKFICFANTFSFNINPTFKTCFYHYFHRIIYYGLFCFSINSQPLNCGLLVCFQPLTLSHLSHLTYFVLQFRELKHFLRKEKGSTFLFHYVRIKPKHFQSCIIFTYILTHPKNPPKPPPVNK